MTADGRAIALPAPDLGAPPTGDVRDWAWTAGFGLLDAHLRGEGGSRLILVPVGDLADVPWHAAARDSDGNPRHACADYAVSYATSAAHVVSAASRPAATVYERPVLVGDPGTDAGVRALRDAIYPNADVLTAPLTGDALGRLLAADGATVIHIAGDLPAPVRQPDAGGAIVVSTSGSPSAESLLAAGASRSSPWRRATVRPARWCSCCTSS